MKITRFDPPGDHGDLPTADLKKRWSDSLSRSFDVGVASVQAFLTANGGGSCAFYNPVSHGRTEPDLPAAAGTVT